jgi:hypothetical protein
MGLIGTFVGSSVPLAAEGAGDRVSGEVEASAQQRACSHLETNRTFTNDTLV